MDNTNKNNDTNVSIQVRRDDAQPSQVSVAQSSSMLFGSTDHDHRHNHLHSPVSPQQLSAQSPQHGGSTELSHDHGHQHQSAQGHQHHPGCRCDVVQFANPDGTQQTISAWSLK